ncbi:class II aldolase/adducin family protein [Pseudomonas kurunegalensis]|uniref:class II aldolase/adducin family protein n=1 Tax=Pseudomonas kurunegalensis TaxID=485880 RepID=UPI0025703AEC|nr:class II aldolase/adducin family protein [Pseudomonas kurunegalensis]WJD65117.1 class II aldolase/adducin family protein [Pseudomonas kurunegalensis]
MSKYYEHPERFSDAEWTARVKLAACYRIFDMLGWSESIYNHISVKVPDAGGCFLVNPFGLHYSEVTASNLVKVDVDGNVIGHSDWPINPAGFTFHGVIHKEVQEAHCVMHTHTTATMAICCSERGLEFTNFYSAMLYDKLAYHEFEGITLHAEEGRRILESSNGKPVLLLKNHGPVVMGSSIANAFSMLWRLQRACEVQLATASLGRGISIDESVLEQCAKQTLSNSPKFGAGEDVFAAMVRLVDRIDTRYKH